MRALSRPMPSSGAVRGRGSAIVERICDEVSISAGPEGPWCGSGWICDLSGQDADGQRARAVVGAGVVQQTGQPDQHLVTGQGGQVRQGPPHPAQQVVGAARPPFHEPVGAEKHQVVDFQAGADHRVSGAVVGAQQQS